MAYYPHATEIGAIYTLVNGSWQATFNDPSDANYAGMLTEVTGLDSPEVRENAADLVESDGGAHGAFYLGRRPIVLNGRVYGHSTELARRTMLDRARNASLALRSDATLSWMPSAYQFKSAMLTSAPAQWLRLTETSGTTAADSSGNARNGTYTGSVGAWTLAQNGFGPDGSYSTSFDGSTGRVITTYNPFTSGSIRTVAGWANRRTNTTADSLYGSDNVTVALRGVAGSNDATFTPDNINSPAQTFSGALPAPGQWFHWAVVYNDTTKVAELFINGVSKGTKTFTVGYNAAPGNIVYGARGTGIDTFDGYLEDVAVWTRGLTAAEIATLYTQGGKDIPRIWTPVRRQQPWRETGQWVKDFQIALVSQYAQLFGWSLKSGTAAAGAGITLENIGNYPSYPTLRITGISGNTTTVTDGHGGTFKTLNTLSLASGEVVEFDMLTHTGTFINNVAPNNRAGQSATRYIDFTSITQWPSLITGNNTFTLASGAAGTLTVLYRDTWA